MEYIKVSSGGFEFEISQLKTCEYFRQIRWTDFDSETGEFLYGIQFGDKVVCSCCGIIFSIDELNEQACIDLCTNWVKVSDRWIDFTDEIARNW